MKRTRPTMVRLCKNKIPFLINDVLREILLRSDIDTIKQYSLTTKQASQLFDQYFYRDKLVLEGIPHFTTFDPKHKDRNIDKYCRKYSIKNKWLVYYLIMKDVNQDANNYMIRNFEPIESIESFYVIPTKRVTNRRNEEYTVIDKIYIHGDQFSIHIYVYDSDITCQEDFNQAISYDKLLNLFTLILFYNTITCDS